MRRIGTVTALTAPLLVAGLLGAGIGTAKPSATSSVTIVATPNPVVFGSSVTISGQASGKKNAGATVTLYAKPAPTYTTATSVGSATTDATGHYSFKTAPRVHTIYYVTVHTAPQATSSQVLVKDKVRITLRVSTAAPAVGQRVRFSGFVLPAYNGRYVLIQRRTPSGWKTLARARLIAATSGITALGATTRSRYNARLRIIKPGTYRVWFNPKDKLRLPHGATRKLTVH